MLITCKECGGNISDKRISCPHCGYPLKNTVRTKHRLPNGFGQISKIKGNLSKPYRAMITVGVKENGRPLCKILKPNGYFATYNEAYNALVEWNNNPTIVEKITMSELYERWSEEHFKKISKGTITTTQGLWKYCHKIYDVPVTDIKRSQVKDCIETGSKEYAGKTLTPSDIQKSMIKILFGQLLDYAMELDLVDKNVAKNIHLKTSSEPKESIHTALADWELEDLWKNNDRDIYDDLLLVRCYSGWRPGELLELRVENINLVEHTFTGGNKTSNGKNRTIPIHSAILPIVRKYYNASNEYLFTKDGKNIPYYTYRHRFEDKYPNHYPHDGRKTFVTLAKKYNVDEYAIKRLVGHSIQDLTERVYTERNIDWLRREIEKIM